MQKINTTFVSDIDLFLRDFDRTHAPSASQLAEIKKYQRVYEARDQPLTPSELKGITE